MNEEKPIREVLSEVFYDNPMIFRNLFDFNFLPASYIHPSRRNLFFDKVIDESIWCQRKTWPRLSRQILKSQSLEDKFSFTICFPGSAYLLLPLPKFRNLALHIGAIMIGSSIRSSLGREDVLQWKHELGNEVFEFVMNRGTLLPDAHISTSTNRMSDIERLGGSLILSGLDELSEAIKKRALLKFHIDSRNLEIDRKAAKNLTNSVLFLLEREWHSLFSEMKNKVNSISR